MSVFVDIISLPILDPVYMETIELKDKLTGYTTRQILWASPEVTTKKSLRSGELKYKAVKKSPTHFIDTD